MRQFAIAVCLLLLAACATSTMEARCMNLQPYEPIINGSFNPLHNFSLNN